MTFSVIYSASDMDQSLIRARAAHVGADITSQYRQLAMHLRRKGLDEVADVDAILDPAERAARRCAFQLYGTAASELEDIIAELLDSLEHPCTSTMQAPSLRVIDGGKAGLSAEDGRVR
jgi:hypothetical protein